MKVSAQKDAWSAFAHGAGGVLFATLFMIQSLEAQLPGTQVPGGCDVPVNQRTSEFGCYLTAEKAASFTRARR
jgi:hypothetical protein